MIILVKDLVAQCDYSPSFFKKILTKNGINNHFSLKLDDLEKLYRNLDLKNFKSFSFKLVLEDILKAQRTISDEERLSDEERNERSGTCSARPLVLEDILNKSI